MDQKKVCCTVKGKEKSAKKVSWTLSSSVSSLLPCHLHPLSPLPLSAAGGLLTVRE